MRANDSPPRSATSSAHVSDVSTTSGSFRTGPVRISSRGAMKYLQPVRGQGRAVTPQS